MRLTCVQLGVTLAVLLAGGMQAQSPSAPIPNRPISDRQSQRNTPEVATVTPMLGSSKVANDFLIRAQMHSQQGFREARLKQMQQDSDRLTALAVELQREVTLVSREPILPVAQIKKAEEIEKLAKRLKQNLRGPV